MAGGMGDGGPEGVNVAVGDAVELSVGVAELVEVGVGVSVPPVGVGEGVVVALGVPVVVTVGVGVGAGVNQKSAGRMMGATGSEKVAGYRMASA